MHLEAGFHLNNRLNVPLNLKRKLHFMYTFLLKMHATELFKISKGVGMYFVVPSHGYALNCCILFETTRDRLLLIRKQNWFALFISNSTK